MSTRISSLIVGMLLLAGCGEQAPDLNVIENVEAEARQQATSDDRIECAAPGSDSFARDCTVERIREDGGLILTVRRTDGGFHRLLKTDDGRGVTAADGAEKAIVTVLDPKTIEVAIGGARYRLPATVGPLPGK